MSELKVLSKEEVDALIKVTQESQVDVSKLATGANNESYKASLINERALKNITELTAAECEKTLSAFLRKKISARCMKLHSGTLGECLSGRLEKHVYTVFNIQPSNVHGMVTINLPFLHQILNLVYGGHIESTESPDSLIQMAGKVGIIIAEKTAQAILDGFVNACADYGKITYEANTTIILPNLTSKLALDQTVYSVDVAVGIGPFESIFSISIEDEFFKQFIPYSESGGSGVAAGAMAGAANPESTLWRSAIETQVIDSYVAIKINLPDVSMKMSDILKLKSGDLIPIADPTDVFICLNDLKLFHGSAGQANNKRVVKIVSEV